MYTSRHKKPLSYDFDLIVVGSGTGGVAAHLAAKEGKKVAVIESGHVGGDNLHGGGIPTKALLKTTQTITDIQSSHQFGVRVNDLRLNYKLIQKWQKSAVKESGSNIDAGAFSSKKVTFIHGRGHFISPWAISVGLRRYTAHKFLITSGSSTKVPEINGLKEAGYLSYQEALNQESLPKSLCIIGGSGLAYEYAQIFSSMGCAVCVIEPAEHLLPHQDPEIGDVATASLELAGVRVYTHAHISSITVSDNKKIIEFKKPGGRGRVAVSNILLATSQQANTDLGLENAGVYFTDNGIRTDKFMRTNKKHIYAAGDVVGEYLTANAGIQEAKIAIHNMYSRKKVALVREAIPHVVYGNPEIATVGVSERKIKLTGIAYQTAIAPIGILGQAITNNYTAGFVKIIANHKGIVIGASIVAPTASEMISLIAFAIQFRRYACDLANIVYPMPSWSEAVRIAAAKIHCI